MKAIKGDTRSLDYGLHVLCSVDGSFFGDLSILKDFIMWAVFMYFQEPSKPV